jgi:competence protein ComEA
MEERMRRFTCALAAVCLSLVVSLAAQEQPAPARRGGTQKPRAAAAASPSAPVNLNTATEAQIASLPGVGPKAAQRIVEYRQKNGGFKKIEELMNVKGIGEKSFLKLKPLIIVSEKAPAAGQ